MSAPTLPSARRSRRLLAVGALLVASITAGIVGLVRPPLRAASIVANESAACRALKIICSAQMQLHAGAVVDTDGDGEGEYGFLAELARTVPLRVGRQDHRAGASAATAELPPEFGRVQGGCLELEGYVIQMFLPGPDGQWVAEADAGGHDGRPIDAARAEREWVVYAWPREPGVTGMRTFVITAAGDLLGTQPHSAPYGGGVKPKPGRAAFRAVDGEWRFAENAVDALGTYWGAVG